MQFMGISLSIMFAGDGIYLQSTGFWFFVLLFFSSSSSAKLAVSQSSPDKFKPVCLPACLSSQPASQHSQLPSL